MLKGVTHAEVGAWLAERWHLPGALVQAIRYHHEPIKAPVDSSLASIVHVADYLARKQQIGFSGDVSFPVLAKGVWKNLTSHSKEMFDLPDLTSYEKYFAQKLESEYSFFETLRLENQTAFTGSEMRATAVEVV